MMSFEQRLLEIRKSRGMSQEALAEKVGVSRQAVSKWETGEALPDYAKLIALADALEVSLDYLCGRKERAESASAPAAEAPEKPRKSWVTAVAVVAVLIVAIAGLWAVKQTNGTDVVDAEEAEASDNRTENAPTMVSGIAFQCFDGEGVSFQFIPRIIGVQYTYIISFTAEGTEKSFVVPLDGTVCRGTVDLGPAGEDYTVTLKMRYLTDEYVEVVATNFHWNVKKQSIGWMAA